MTRTTKNQLLAGTSALALAAACSMVSTAAFATSDEHWVTTGQTATDTQVQTATGCPANCNLTVLDVTNFLNRGAGVAATSTIVGSGVTVNSAASTDVDIVNSGDNSTIVINGAGTVGSAGIQVTKGRINGANTTGATNGVIVVDGAANTTAGLGGTLINVTANGQINNSGANGTTLQLGNSAAVANDFTVTNAGTILDTSGTGSTILVGSQAASSLTVNNTGTLSATNAAGNAITVGALTKATVNNSGAGAITGIVNIGTNAASAINTSGTSTITGAVTMGAAGQVLTMTGTSLITGAVTVGGGTVNLSGGTVTGAITGAGILNSTVNTVTNGVVGGTPLTTINITDGTTLDTATHSNNISGTNILLGTSTAGGTLKIGGNTVTGLINSSTTDTGTGVITVVTGATLGAGTTIGATRGIATINITDGVILNDNTNGNTIKATNVVLGTSTGVNAELDLGAGAVTGAIDGKVANQGIVKFKNDNTLNGNIGATTGIASIVVTDSKTLDASVNNNSIKSAAIVLGDATTAGATLKLGTGTVTGTVDGDTAGVGTLTFTASQTLNAASAIGNTNALATVNINDGVTINDTANNVIKATNVTIGSTNSTGSVLTLGTGAVTGSINSHNSGVGVLNITGNQTTGGVIGTGTKLAAINISDGKTVTLGGAIKATAINIGTSTAGATLATGTNNMTGAIDSAYAGTGTLNVTGSSTLGATSTIGATNGLAAINITDTKTLDASTAGATIKATQITLGTAGAGTGVLTLGTGAVTGAIDGHIAGAGTVNFTASNTMGGNIGATTGIGTVAVTNGSTITANAHSIKSTALSLDSGSILNLTTGVVTGGIDGDAGAHGTVNFAGTQTTAGAIGGANNLLAVNVNNGAIVSLGEVAGDTIKAVTTTVNDGGRLNFGGTAHTVKGNVTGAGAGIIDIGTQTQTLAAGDNGGATGVFTTAVGGETVRIGVRDKTTNDNGNIITAGDSTIHANTKLVVDLTGVTGYMATVTDRWLTVGGNLTGGTLAAGNVSTTSPLFTATDVGVAGAGGTHNVVLTRVAGGYAGVANSVGNVGAATILEALGVANNANAQVVAFQTQLERSTSVANFNATLNSAVPQINQGSVQAVASTTQSLDVVGSRLSQLRAGIDNSSLGMAAGGHVADRGLWIQAFGTAATQDTRSNVAGYDANTGGAAVGGDMAINDATRLGVSLSYAKSSVDGNGATPSSTDIDSYQVNAYGTHTMGQWYSDGLLGFAYHNYNSDRSVTGVGIANSGDYNGETYTARVGGGYHFLTYNGLDITPNAALTYYFNHTEGYTETGAGGLNNIVQSSDQNALIGRIGADVGYSWNYGSMLVRPVVRAAYMYDFVGDQLDTTSQFTGGGATFKVKDASPERSSFDVGASLNIARTDNISFSADYDYQGRSDYSAHSGMLRARYNF